MEAYIHGGRGYPAGILAESSILRLTAWLSKYVESILRGDTNTLEEQDIRAIVKPKVEKLTKFDTAMKKYGDLCILDSDPCRPEDPPIVYHLGYPNADRYSMGDKRFGPQDCSSTTKPLSLSVKLVL